MTNRTHEWMYMVGKLSAAISIAITDLEHGGPASALKILRAAKAAYDELDAEATKELHSVLKLGEQS